ncbi:MAG: NADH-quinone oxidoreductase subunit H [Phycisphaeraceae bacterium]|nr:NADH-quinone oxidoreductase subunit H [Phycisphaeraceae bacterium]
MISAQLFISVCVILVVVHAILGATAYLIFLERKVASWAQDRIGPNRVGFGMLQAVDGLLDRIGLGWLYRKSFGGLGQALADGIKLLLKEDYTPPNVDKVLFFLGPVLVVIPALIGWAVVPWGGNWDFPGLTLFGTELVAASPDGKPAVVAVAPVNIGVVYLLAIGSVAVYGLVLGAYASNNKYSFLGGLRATAQMLSYEIPMGICVLIMILYYQSTDAGFMANTQASTHGVGTWGIFAHPLLAIIFFICILAEANRAPFDLAEAEQELVGGFHTEYSSMKWALFFLGEYMHMITGCAFFAILFLGGWDILPFVNETPITAGGEGGFFATALGGLLLVLMKFGVFTSKIFLLLFIQMWVRWTLPRLRFDQLMKLAWNGMIPLMIVFLVVVGLMTMLSKDYPWLGQWWMFAIANVAMAVVAAAIAPLLPSGPPVNRKVPLAGSRFSPLEKPAS